MGRRDEAAAAFRRSIELKPDYARAHFNLANLLREEGHVKTAVPHYQHALRSQPGWADAHWNLGATLFELGELAESRRHLQQALKLDPTHQEIHVTLGHVALADGDLTQAAEQYRLGIDEETNRFLVELRINSLPEPIPPDEQYIDDYQRRLLERLKQAVGESSAWEPEDLPGSGAEPPMALAYQGRNVRPILEAYAALFAAKIESGEPVRNDGRPRIGIVVTHGHEGVFARCWGGIAERLSRQRFDVRLICSRSGANVLKQMIRIADDEYLVMPEKLVDMVEAIRAERFDLLHYWEIGTDATNYFLPFYQPARLQTNAGGWPVTSGHTRSTHFVSWRLLEPPGAAAHYCEELAMLERLPMYYERPAASGWQRSRETWGIPAKAHFYLCTQNLRKYHPQFDAVVAELLRTDPQGRLGIVADSQAGVTRRLQDRWRHVMPDVFDRIQVMPRLERADYLQVVSAADVILDTFPYGGGVNTVCDAMAVGTPMVSMPGEFQRSRWVSAVSTLMGVHDTIVASPAEYVARARQLAGEPDFRRQVVERIAPAAAELFAEPRTIDEHNEFFSRLIEEMRSG